LAKIQNKLQILKEKCGECKISKYDFNWQDGDTNIKYGAAIPDTKGSLGQFSEFFILYGYPALSDEKLKTIRDTNATIQQNGRDVIDKIGRIAKKETGKDF